MQTTERPPEELSERQLFKKYIEISNYSSGKIDSHEKTTPQKRQAALLAEVGERLETLEAVKSMM